jgi:hypothetical protein
MQSAATNARQTEWKKVLLEKITVAQLVKKLSACYGILRYIYYSVHNSTTPVPKIEIQGV